jgi:hypothetical protein
MPTGTLRPHSRLCVVPIEDAELQFSRAMEDYKRRSGRMFPTWSEVLEVLRSLGYEKQPRSPDGSGLRRRWM